MTASAYPNFGLDFWDGGAHQHIHVLWVAVTMTFAIDLKDEGITVICYCPGWCVLLPHNSLQLLLLYLQVVDWVARGVRMMLLLMRIHVACVGYHVSGMLKSK